MINHLNLNERFGKFVKFENLLISNMFVLNE